jgi:hypothetical protein
LTQLLQLGGGQTRVTRQATARGTRSVAAAGDISGTVITGDPGAPPKRPRRSSR